MDGMVEYTRPSPHDGTVGSSGFRESMTFDFALNMTANTENRHTQAARIQHTKTSWPKGLLDTSGWSSLDPVVQDEMGTKNDAHEALKAYMDQSSLKFLPQRHVASTLLDRYFSTVHAVWPFLIEADTRAELERTWTTDKAPSQTWIAQLNLIFAITCQFYDPNEEAPFADIYKAGRLFYLRANGFLIANCHSLCSIKMLQTLLLAVQYQQGTLRSDECYSTIGIATRMAFGLGLHTLSAADSSLPALEIELRRRLWWGCFSLDRYATLGRLHFHIR